MRRSMKKMAAYLLALVMLLQMWTAAWAEVPSEGASGGEETVTTDAGEFSTEEYTGDEEVSEEYSEEFSEEAATDFPEYRAEDLVTDPYATGLYLAQKDIPEGILSKEELNALFEPACMIDGMPVKLPDDPEVPAAFSIDYQFLKKGSEEASLFAVLTDAAAGKVSAEDINITELLSAYEKLENTDTSAFEAGDEILVVALADPKNEGLKFGAVFSVIVAKNDPSEDESEKTSEENETEESENATGLILQKAKIMYGESGSNENGNLDLLFAPKYVTEDKEIQPISKVSYKFFTDAQTTDTLTADNFESLQGAELETLDAGTTVLAAVRAELETGEAFLATQSVTIAKRKLTVRMEKTEEVEITEKDVPENGKLVISEKDDAYRKLMIEPAGAEGSGETVSGFSVSEAAGLSPEEVLAGEVVLDVSLVDTEALGFQEVPVEAALSEEFSANYEIAEEAVGYVYVDEASYSITFTASNDGKTETITYPLALTSSQTLRSFLSSGGRMEAVNSMNGLIKAERGDEIYGWKVTRDAEAYDGYDDILDPDFAFDGTDLSLNPKTDYHLAAILSRKASDNIIIESIPSVSYDGRKHVVVDAELKSSQRKKSINDIELIVYARDIRRELRYGKDYKVSYKNNTAASMKVGEDGKYVRSVSDDKRPYVIVTGIGSYKGFSAKVFFDILPHNIGTTYPYAEISGLKNVYALSGGKIKGGKISPKVTVRFYYSYPKNNKYSLKAGTDYTPIIYKYNEGTNRWDKQTVSDPNKITEEGRYLFTARGTGNYCGTACGLGYANFDDGSAYNIDPEVSSYTGMDFSSAQFIVMSDTTKDLKNASISIKHKKVAFNKDKDYNGDNLGIKVTIGKGADKRTLTEGKDYYITYDGVDYQYIDRVRKETSGNVYYTKTDNAVYYSSIKIANKYKVRITAIDGSDYFGYKNAKSSVRIKGVRINAKWFTLRKKSSPYNGKNVVFSTEYRDVRGVSVRDIGSLLTFDSLDEDNYRKSNYQDVKTTLTPADAVSILYRINKLPGTYESTVYPVGPGVDHDYAPKIKFKRTAISVKTAMSKGLLKVTVGDAVYNKGGALPSSVSILYNGRWNDFGQMVANGQRYWISDGDHWTSVYLYAHNNKKAGSGAYITVKAGGTPFKGKSSKKIKYSVDPIPVSDTVIPVLEKDSYVKSYGKITSTLDGNYYDYGELVAVMESAKKTEGTLTPGISIYQCYYANNADYENRQLSLAKLKSDQYKLVLTPVPGSDNSYSVSVQSNKTAIVAGFTFTNVSLSQPYTVYDVAATITGVKAVYNGTTYNYPEDKGTPLTFTGAQIRPAVTEVTLSDGTVLKAEDGTFKVEYGSNVAVGDGKKTGGSFKVILTRNNEGKYPYGASKTFTFAIKKADDITV